ncbi:MAG TPA: PilZ domain-containing protein [Spirochaetota bacterium]|nr:PilZ domain-containing protein [Spirochaetota bacterium]HOM38606.1 PilZ domain-containing protein [Spirochaetota bacterium]HPQ49743.1 PilZ domain-containing protein [Spirochaetota bacterium]
MDQVLEAYEERRRYKREKSFLVGLVNKKLVYIEDISRGGVKLLSAENIGAPGDRVILDTHLFNDKLDSHILIKSKIVWVREIENGYGFYVGLEFIDDSIEFDNNFKHIWEINNFLLNIRNKFID